MPINLAYSYLYTARTLPPDWFQQYMRDYLERFLPQYASLYINADVQIEEAPFSTIPANRADWEEFLFNVRNQITAGYDSIIILSDAHYDEIAPGLGAAGENFYKLQPNLGWATVRNWEQVMQVVNSNAGSYLADPWYAMQIGEPGNPGIGGLVTAGHEMIHYILLHYLGFDAAASPDNGEMPGMVFLDDNLRPVPTVDFGPPPNWRYAAQRISKDLKCMMGIGGYPCEQDNITQAFNWIW